MKILIVGGGAVGQVYGRHLQLGGAAVTLLVRPRQAAQAEAGFDLYPLHEKGARERPVRFRAESVRTSVAEVAEAWDAIVLCVSSTALREGSWLAEIGGLPAASFVTLQPGIDDAAFVAERVGEDRLVTGMIPFLSYAAPLSGEALPRPGTAYYVPPFARFPLSGSEERVRPLALALTRGGLRARRHPDVGTELAFGAALLDPHMAALECAGFDLRRFQRDGALLRLAAAASAEATAIAARVRGARRPAGAALMRPLAVRLLTLAAPALVPFDLEAFLRVHYTKVGGQTRHLLRTYVEIAERRGLDHAALQELAERLEAGSGTARRTTSKSALGPRAARALRRRHLLCMDPTQGFAIKRNVHEIEVGADAASVARALGEVLSDPEEIFGVIQVKRPAAHVGHPFAVGERFHGCIRLDRVAARLPGRMGRAAGALLSSRSARSAVGVLEDAFLSDYAEILEIVEPPDGEVGAYEVHYGYLSGTPLAGRSIYSVEPIAPGRARVRQIFEYQEQSALAVSTIHCFAARLHDEVVHVQVEKAAARLGARVLASTVPAGYRGA
jgi:2-dehydropantoate 2-reductase